LVFSDLERIVETVYQRWAMIRSAFAVLRIADNSAIDGDKGVYQDLTEAAQSRLGASHYLMIRSLLGP